MIGAVHRASVILTLLALLVIAAPAPPTHASDALPASGQVWIDLALGWSWQRQGGLQDWFDSERARVGPVVGTRGWRDAFPPGTTPRLELGAFVTPRWSVAASAEHFESRVEHESFDVSTGRWLGWDATVETAYTEYALHAAYWPERVPGLHVGLRLGAGHGRVKVHGGGRLDPANANAATLVDALADGTVMAPGAYVGWRSSWQPDPRVCVRAGWSARDLGTVEGRGGRPPLTDFEGDAVPLDFGGPSVSLGFVFGLGRVR